ncbi:MAG: SPFH domain-containing protein [Chloroflexia bacterium]|nr:SPFH domain-containing protein [Chloroflexia bacterium]
MFGISYIKVDPTMFVLHYSSGKIVREGTGLSFFYVAPSSSIVAVPIGSHDVPFIFNEVSADFQTITIQGQLTYRVVDPKRVAGLLNFSLASDGKTYVSEDPEKLPQRIVNLAQVLTRGQMKRMPLREALVSSEVIVSGVLEAAWNSETLASLGVELLAFSILAVRPTPEMARALEAEAREELQKEADQAVYARRNAAVEQERLIKENELNTEIAVEEKKRQIRETQMEAEIAVEELKRRVREVQMDTEIVVEEKQRQVRETRMAADIALEEDRQTLVSLRTDNTRAEADAQAYAIEVVIKPLVGLDHKTLLALASQSADPRLMVAMAFQELAGNAAKIGQLNITPDLLESLLQAHG